MTEHKEGKGRRKEAAAGNRQGLLLLLYLNINFTHNFALYLRFVNCLWFLFLLWRRLEICMCNGNSRYDSGMCVHVYVFSLLHVACGMRHVACGIYIRFGFYYRK